MLPRNMFSSDAERLAALRDWFAGQALSGVIEKCSGDTKPKHMERAEYLALTAYQMADAMLAERAKGGVS